MNSPSVFFGARRLFQVSSNFFWWYSRRSPFLYKRVKRELPLSAAALQPVVDELTEKRQAQAAVRSNAPAPGSRVHPTPACFTRALTSALLCLGRLV